MYQILYSTTNTIFLLGFFALMFYTGLMLHFKKWDFPDLFHMSGLQGLFCVMCSSVFTAYMDTSDWEFPDVCKYYFGAFGKWSSLIFSLVSLVGAMVVYWVLMSNFLFNTGKFIYSKWQLSPPFLEFFCRPLADGMLMFSWKICITACIFCIHRLCSQCQLIRYFWHKWNRQRWVVIVIYYDYDYY